MFRHRKDGKLSSTMLNSAILAIILLVVLFQTYAELVPEAQDAGDELNDSTICENAGGYWNDTTSACTVSITNATAVAYTPIPLGGLFSSSGFVFVLVMAALIVLVVRSFLPGGK